MNQNDSNNSAKLSYTDRACVLKILRGETGTHMVASDWRHMRRLQACLKQTQLEVHTKMHQKTIHQSLISDAAIMTMGTNIASGVEFYVVKSTP